MSSIAPLPFATVPLPPAPVPMELFSTTLPVVVEPSTRIPQPVLPLMTLAALLAVPPTLLPDAPLSNWMPTCAVARLAALPFLSVPM